MRVAEEYVSDHMWRVAVHDLVEEIRRIWQRIGLRLSVVPSFIMGIAYSIPTAKHVTNDPHRLPSIFRCLQLVDHPLELSRDIWVASVDEVEVVGLVPEIGVESYDTKTGICLDAVASIMGTSI